MRYRLYSTPKVIYNTFSHVKCTISRCMPFNTVHHFTQYTISLSTPVNYFTQYTISLSTPVNYFTQYTILLSTPVNYFTQCTISMSTPVNYFTQYTISLSISFHMVQNWFGITFSHSKPLHAVHHVTEYTILLSKLFTWFTIVLGSPFRK